MGQSSYLLSVFSSTKVKPRQLLPNFGILSFLLI